MSDTRIETRKSIQVTFSCGFQDDAVGNLFFQTANLSSGGALIKTALVLEPGTKFFADIPWPNKPDQKPIRVQCEVVHAKKERGERFMGIRFIDLDNITKVKLNDLYGQIDEKAELQKQQIKQKKEI